MLFQDAIDSLNEIDEGTDLTPQSLLLLRASQSALEGVRVLSALRHEVTLKRARRHSFTRIDRPDQSARIL
jgi:hypothetical protein